MENLNYEEQSGSLFYMVLWLRNTEESDVDVAIFDAGNLDKETEENYPILSWI